MKKLILIPNLILKQKPEYFYPNKRFSLDCNNLNKSDYFKFPYLIQSEIQSFYTETEKIYNSLIKCLTFNLNNLHSLNWNERSWQVYLGHWLKKFININYNKFILLKKIKNQIIIKKVYTNSSKNISLSTIDTSGIDIASHNFDWESVVLSRIAPIVFKNENIINLKKKINLENIYIQEKEKLSNNIKTKITNYFFLISENFSKDDKYFIYDTYFEKFYVEKILEILLGITPKKWNKINHPKTTRNLDIASRNKLNFKKNNVSELENIIRNYLHVDLPLHCIENLSKIKKLSYDNNWPKKPKKIFTSVAFQSDEVFKFYLSNNINNGTKYYLGQHGNNYSTKIDNEFSVEMNTCDKFFSWGYGNHKKNISTFNFKVFKKIKRTKKQYLTIVMRSRGWRFLFGERLDEAENDIDQTIELAKNLNANIFKDTIIKPHKNLEKFDYFINNNYKNNLPIEKNLSLKNLLYKSKLVLFNYDSTGFLENLVHNIPSICILPMYNETLNNFALKDYNKLIEKQIFFRNHNDALSFINNNWRKIDNWWFDDDCQKVINFFKDKYSSEFSFKKLFKFANQIKDKN